MQVKNSEVMLSPRCNSVFDKEVAKKLERVNPYQAKKFVWRDKPKEPSSNKGKVPTKFQGRTYVPTSNASPREWLHPDRKSQTSGGKWKIVNIDVSALYQDNSQVSKKYSHVFQNYMGKNPMTRTQWRRHQRNKKVAQEAGSSSRNDSVWFIDEGRNNRQ